MKSVRRRLTYANVMSSIAVFLVLGGATAVAATTLGKNTVGSKQLKNNAVTSAKIKNGAVTGAKLKLSSVGKVPSATTADTATSATTATTATTANSANTANTANTANSANSVDGMRFAKILYRVPATAGAQVVFNNAGLVITANCNGEAPIVTATTTKVDSSIYVRVLDSGSNTETFQEILESGEFDPGVPANMLAGKVGNNDLSSFEYDAVDGSVVTGLINTDTDGALDGCRVTGTATFG